MGLLWTPSKVTVKAHESFPDDAQSVVMSEQCTSNTIKGTLLVHRDYFNVLFCTCMYVCRGTYVEVRRYLMGDSSLLLPCEIWG